MGANDATHRPVLDAENKPSLVVEARAWADELEGVLFDGAPVAEVGLIRRLADALEEAEKVRPLHSIATQRTVDLASVIEKAKQTSRRYRELHAGGRASAIMRDLESVDTAGVLAEHDREVAAKALRDAHARVESWPVTSRSTVEVMAERRSILRFLENHADDIRSGRVPVPKEGD